MTMDMLASLLTVVFAMLFALYVRFLNQHRREIGSQYMTRWILFQSSWGGIYLHRFHGSDPEPCLHDHPWNFVTLILKSGYWETSKVRFARKTSIQFLKPWHLYRRPAEFRHKVTVQHGTVPWSLVFVGPRIRTWGFIDLQTGRWKRWDLYIAQTENRITEPRELSEQQEG